MKIIIIGCGKVGLTLAELLSAEKHDVVLIDESSHFPFFESFLIISLIYSSLAPFAKAHLRCFPLLRSSFLLIKWRSLRALLSSDFRASTESERRRVRVNCNKFSLQKYLVIRYPKGL